MSINRIIIILFIDLVFLKVFVPMLFNHVSAWGSVVFIVAMIVVNYLLFTRKTKQETK